MRKTLSFFAAIFVIAVTFTACNQERTEPFAVCEDCHLVTPDQVSKDTIVNKTITIYETTPLWDIAEQYLGDGYRGLEIGLLNFDIFGQPERWLFGQEDTRNWMKEPTWLYAVALPGETLYMPDDAEGGEIETIESTIVAAFDLKEAKDYEYRIIKDGKKSEVSPKPDKPKKDREAANFDWFEKAFLWLMFIAAAGLLLYFLYWLWQRRPARNPYSGGSGGNGGNGGESGAAPNGGSDDPENQEPTVFWDANFFDIGYVVVEDASPSHSAEDLCSVIKQCQEKKGDYAIQSGNTTIMIEVHDDEDGGEAPKED